MIVLEDLLTAGSGVRLPAPLALLVDSKRSLDGDTQIADAVGGVFLEAESPAALHTESLDDVLREIENLEQGFSSRRSTKSARRGARRLSELAALPEPVRNIAMEALANGGWRFAAFGITTLTLVLEDNMRAELIRIEPGAGVARHDHTASEYSLVLQGAFEDAGGTFGRGDFCSRGPGDVHQPRARPGEVCFSLAVSEAPLVFGNLLDVLQKFTRH